jgi:metal-dependent amidase/aminoacylase/carboxypeptidase family protein
LPVSAFEFVHPVLKVPTMQIPHLINLLHGEMTAWRQDLHAHPELGFEEHRTSEFVAGKLAEFGCEVHRNIGKTGVVGVLRTGDGPSIGLRADMDALPIHEANDIPYRSKHEGIMHACGHGWPHNHAVGRGTLPSRDTQLRWHRRCTTGPTFGPGTV